MFKLNVNYKPIFSLIPSIQLSRIAKQDWEKSVKASPSSIYDDLVTTNGAWTELLPSRLGLMFAFVAVVFLEDDLMLCWWEVVLVIPGGWWR